MFFSFEDEDKYSKYVRKVIQRIKDFPPRFIPAGANTQANTALAIMHETKIEDLNYLNPDEPFFGFIVTDSVTGYIGKVAVRDSIGEGIPASHQELVNDLDKQIVMNFQSKAASGFYRATPRNPRGLKAKRIYFFANGKLINVSDDIFDTESQSNNDDTQSKPVRNPVLESVLDSPRTREIKSIASTLSSEQYGILELDHQSWIGLQGGPGTGKSIVALHRLSLISHRAKEEKSASPNLKLLFIAPTERFLEYVQNLLPGQLGESNVSQKSFYDVFGIAYTKSETDFRVKKFKSDDRMFELASHAVWDRLYPKSEIVFEFNGIYVSFGIHKQLELSIQAKSLSNYNDARNWLIDNSFREIETLFRIEISEGNHDKETIRQLRIAIQNESEFKKAIKFDSKLRDLAPKVTAQELHKRLFTNLSQFRASWRAVLADDYKPESDETWVEFEELVESLITDESLYQISDLDVPMIFIMDCLINGTKIKWDHIAIDEVQDRSPLELAAIGFMLDKNSGITALGDLAQNTEPWFYTNWEDLWSFITHSWQQRFGIEKNYELLNLAYSYRVPRDILDRALIFRPLTEIDDYSIEAVKDYKQSGLHIEILRRDFSPISVASRLPKHISDLPEGSSLCIITSNEKLLDSVNIFKNSFGENVSILSVEESKGLEFDVVAVIDPVGMFRDFAIVHGQDGAARRLWIAYTRATKKLIEFCLTGEDVEDYIDGLLE